MKRIVLGLLLLLHVSSCMQTENSNTLDEETYGADGSPQFNAARAVMLQSCVPCHSFHTQTEAQLKTSGLIIAGDPNGSKLYFRLIGSAGAGGPKNMPTNGALTVERVETIRTWIETGTF